MKANGSHSLVFMPQLHSLRALAILAVMYTHYLPEKYWIFGIYWGGLGVRCFFVLSGFLITSILLRESSAAPSFKPLYLTFISRRAFRLYPILLITLVAGAALGIEAVRETFLWDLTYLTNFYVIKINDWPGAVAHLWSLAVEEQFYLVWPFVIFFVPRHLLPTVLFSLIAVSPIFRLAWSSAGLGDFGAWVMPPACFDALAMGALLALFKAERRLIGVVGLVGFCLWLAVTFSPIGRLWFVANAEIALTAVSMIFVWVIARAAVGFAGLAGRILRSRVLQYVGTISYGMYVLHGFVPYYVDLVGVNHVLRWSQSTMLAFATTFLMASVSWHILEQPMMRWGRRLIDSRKEPAAPGFATNLRGDG